MVVLGVCWGKLGYIVLGHCNIGDVVVIVLGLRM